ncbi:MAG: metallophosphoesterase [Oscillospiraceae bacterium]|nr:metallophosphoesterase [Oscillospiraceae bacterium]
MNTVRILHAADLHLDSPFESHSAGKAALRRSEQRGLLLKLALLAEKEHAEIMLLAGDILDSDSAYLDTAEMAEQTLGRLSIPVFISPGNHDYYSSKSPYARLNKKPNIHIFQKSAIEYKEFPEQKVRVWGAGFTDRSSPPLLEGFCHTEKADFLNIMVIHGEAGVKDSAYNPISESDLQASGMDYVALGHNHTFSGLMRAGNTVYAWPGCAEGRGFDETGDKGVIIADIGKENRNLKFLSLRGRKYEILRIDVSGHASASKAVSAGLPLHDTTRDICRIVLTGECDVKPDTAAILRETEGRFFELSVSDKTVLRRDIWEKAGGDTLRGLFLTKMRQKFDAAETEEEREFVSAAVKYGLAALDNREEETLI